MAENATISLREFLEKKKKFVIPNYQRGYIWGKSRGSEKNSVQYALESISNCIENDTDLFMQGITVTETNNEIVLIDGQQRTTFFYLLLTYLGYKGQFEIEYPTRAISQNFLNIIKEETSADIEKMCADNEYEDFQDIYYFKKTIRLISDHKDNLDKNIDIILDKVQFLYITIPKDKATLVFSMMNGSKAVMKTEEIIKAEMLRLVSLEKSMSVNNISSNALLVSLFQKVKEVEALHWEQNLLRSKYAREWDKWLYWWNREDVSEFYHTGRSVMGILVKTYLKSKLKSKNVKIDEEKYFEVFRDNLLRGEKNNEKMAKDVFYDLRRLQKKFEDVFNNNQLYNKIGAILTLHNTSDRDCFIRWYFATDRKQDEIETYYKLVFLNLTHDKIKDNDEEAIENSKETMLQTISSDNLYNEEDKEPAYRQLLRKNIEEDTRLDRRFDFNIWKERSLEHIFPKSKVYHKDINTGKNMIGVYGENKKDEELQAIEEGMLNRVDFGGNGSEHCIGNLVLLYKNENSKFGAKSVEEKKNIYFTPDPNNKTEKFKSRHLLHTISVFAQYNWGIEKGDNGIPHVVSTIQKNKQKFIDEIKKVYDIQ